MSSTQRPPFCPPPLPGTEENYPAPRRTNVVPLRHLQQDQDRPHTRTTMNQPGAGLSSWVTAPGPHARQTGPCARPIARVTSLPLVQTSRWRPRPPMTNLQVSWLSRHLLQMALKPPSGARLRSCGRPSRLPPRMLPSDWPLWLSRSLLCPAGEAGSWRRIAHSASALLMQSLTIRMSIPRTSMMGMMLKTRPRRSGLKRR